MKKQNSVSPKIYYSLLLISYLEVSPA
jgi:hypothetical protein